MRVLLMVLKKEWFDKIASGEKKKEYREYKAYWADKLIGREYDEILFINGYRKDAPKMRVEFKGYSVSEEVYPLTGEKKQLFIINLGRVIEINGKKRKKESRGGDKIFNSVS